MVKEHAALFLSAATGQGYSSAGQHLYGSDVQRAIGMSGNSTCIWTVNCSMACLLPGRILSVLLGVPGSLTVVTTAILFGLVT